jgi:hypothetical protein
MTFMTGNAKLQRAANQMENAEKLLLNLPEHFYKSKEQKEILEKLAKDIFAIKQSIENEIIF